MSGFPLRFFSGGEKTAEGGAGVQPASLPARSYLSAGVVLREFQKDFR